MAGYILILAIIILGGTIATVGDHLGSRVGKARLSLFNLRPRKTAVLITILTGSVISASTLGILFATNKELRDAVFRIETIQRQRRSVEAELREVQNQKEKMEAELAGARTELGEVRQQLTSVNQSLNQAIARQKQTQNQLNQLQNRFLEAQANLQQFSEQARVLQAEIVRLVAEERQLRRDRAHLAAQRNQAQERLLQAEAENQQIEIQKQKLEQAIAQAQERLQQAEKAVIQAQERLQQVDTQRLALVNQQSVLRNEIAALEENRKRLEKNVEVLLLGLRRGNITIRAGQVMASGIVQGVKTRQEALQATETLLREARRAAILLTNSPKIGPEQRVIQIRNEDVERLVEQISDGQAYVIRILAAANYLEGEELVLVLPQIAPNQVVFGNGEQVASVSLNPADMTDEQILERLDYLFAISNRRAIQSGILPDPLTGTVGSFPQIDLIRFVLQLKEYEGDVAVTAIAPQTVYTSGPLRLSLVATLNQKVILRSS